MNLETLQTTLIQRVIDDHDDAIHFRKQLKPCGHLSVARQIDIYRSNVQSALASTLKQIYPVCLRILGEHYFSQISQAFIHKHPSDSANLNHYGQDFPDFLRTLLVQRSELSGLPYLADLAQLEQFHHDIYFVKNDTAFDFEQLATLSEHDYQKLCFKLSATLRLMNTRFPILSIWQINQKVTVPDEVFELPKPVENLAIVRPHLQVEIEVITTDLYHFLMVLEKGIIFTELISQFETVANFDVDDQLTELIAKGWISGFKVANV